MIYKELEKYLFNEADPKFADFSKSLSNSEYISIGVKNPVLRDLIKKHKEDNELALKDFKLGIYLEIDFIYFGLTLSRLSSSKEQLDFLLKEIRFAKSWAITDCMSSFMKKTTFKDFYDFFLKAYNSKYTYERRMAYILALKQFKDARVLQILPKLVQNEEYMVMMAEAWLLSTLAIQYEDEIFEYLNDIKDISLKRKTISKICDSYRFSEQSKNRFKELRTKKYNN